MAWSSDPRKDILIINWNISYFKNISRLNNFLMQYNEENQTIYILLYIVTTFLSTYITIVYFTEIKHRSATEKGLLLPVFGQTMTKHGKPYGRVTHHIEWIAFKRSWNADIVTVFSMFIAEQDPWNYLDMENAITFYIPSEGIFVYFYVYKIKLSRLLSVCTLYYIWWRKLV